MNKKQIALLQWFLPTRIEIVFYLFIGLVTLGLSDLGAIERLFLIPENVDLNQTILGSSGSIMRQILGSQTSSIVIQSLFWGVVGSLVYSLLWLLSNFSTEVNNDLAVKEYVKPAGADPFLPLKTLVGRALFRVTNIVLLAFAAGLVIQVMLPLWIDSFQNLIHFWPQGTYIIAALLSLAAEIISLHIITVLARLSLLRKRVFG